MRCSVVVLTRLLASLLLRVPVADGDFIIDTAWGERIVPDEELPAYEAYNQAVDAVRSNRVENAVALYEAALLLKPNLADALINLSSLLIARARTNDVDVARTHLISAVSCADHPTVQAAALSNLGHLEQKAGGHDHRAAEIAEDYYLQALVADPSFVDALFNYGTLLDSLSRFDDAAAQYRAVLVHRPDHGTAQLNLANCMFHKGDLQSAIEAQSRLWKDESKSLESRISALNNAGQVYRDAGEHGEALRMFAMALELLPGDALTIANALQARRTLCAWHGMGELQQRLVAATKLELAGKEERNSTSGRSIKGPGVSLQPYDALLMPEISLEQQRDVAIAHASPWNSASLLRRRTELLSACEEEEVTHPPAAKKVRVLYLGFDFREHPMGHLTKGLVTGHNQKAFHTAVASYGDADGSPIRQRFQTEVDSFLELRGVADREASELMTKESPDIVIDLMAHTRGTRSSLAASKPDLAITVNYLGYPSTMGGAYVEYALVDRVAVPPETASKAFSEKLVYLPNSYQANEYPLSAPLCSGSLLAGAADNFSSSSLPPQLQRAKTCVQTTSKQFLSGKSATDNENSSHDDLDNTQPVFTICNFNNIDKFEHVSFSVWMSLLREHPSSVLVLLSQSSAAEENLRLEAASLGVHPTRLRFMPRVSKEKHLLRLSGCDLSVDNFVYGMHTTLADALWAAVPTVTCRGFGVAEGGEVHGRMQSRVGTSLLKAAGGFDTLLAAHSLREFEETANRILSSERLRLMLRMRLAQAALTKPLFDTPLLTQHVEKAYQGMLEVKHAAKSCSTKAFLPMIIPERQTMHLVLTSDDDDNSHISRSSSGSRTNRRELWALEALMQCLEDTTTCTTESALATSERLLSAAPDHADAWHLRGLGLYRQGSHLSAITAIRKALKLQPSAFFFWSNLATVSRAAGLLPEAASALKMVLALTPYDVRALIELQSLLGTGNVNSLLIFDALAAFWQSSGSLPSDARALSEAALNHAMGIAASSSSSSSDDQDLVVMWAQEALRFDPQNHHAHLKLGAALEAAGRYEEAMTTFLSAVEAQHRSDFEAAVQIERGIGNGGGGSEKTGQEEASPHTRRVRTRGGGESRPSLAIYCYEYGQTWWPNWGPRSLGSSGLGGSEEAVVFLSREMVLLGYHVEVYASPPAEDAGKADDYGVWWLDYRTYDMSNAPDVFVAWRYHISAALVPAELNANAVQQNLSELSSNNRGTGTTKVFVWLQDVPSFATYTKSFTDSLAGIFTLSSFHSRQLPLHAQSKTIVTPNGIDPDFFVDGSNSPTRFVYGSAPNRGLETVLRLWPFIRDAIITNYTSAVGSTAPSPRLDVYYGFTPAFVKYGQRSIPDFEEWRHKMEQLLEQDGVHYHGMVDHVTLAKGYASAGFVLYPTTYPETGCVTLMKAMAMGAVPITSRFAESTLPELTESFDLGPRPLLVLEEQQKEAQPLLSRVGQQHKQKDSGWTNEWAKAVVTASLRDLHGDGLAEHRAEMKRGSRRRFLWANVAQLWNGAFV